MNKLLTLFKTIRLPNLLMLALTQWIVAVHFVNDYQIVFTLLVSLSTVSIALAAYLLNDIRDIDIDRVNGKMRMITHGNKSNYTQLVVLFNTLGLILGFLAAYYTKIYFFTYFVAAVVILTAYAFFLSKYKFVGNLVISFLIALAILLSFYLAVNHPNFNRKYYSLDTYLVWLYAAFAFLLNWLREVVKDLEDQEGDLMGKRQSLALLIGPKLTKTWVASQLFLLCLLFLANFLINLHQLASLHFYALFLGMLSLLCFIGILPASSKKAYARISLLIKIIMLIGLLSPFFI